MIKNGNKMDLCTSVHTLLWILLLST